MESQPSRIAIVFRMFIFIFVVCLVLMGLFASFPIILSTAFFATLIYVVIFRGIVNGLMNLMYGNDPDYQQYKRMGGDPYLDSLPNPINPTGHLETFVMPNPEPEYREFIPPRYWRWQCNTCFARVEYPVNECWNCGVRLD